MRGTGAASLRLALALGAALALLSRGPLAAAGSQNASPSPAPQALRTVPWPDLAGLEPAVRDTLQLASSRLAKGTPDSEAYGELGRLFHAHGFTTAAEACYDNAASLAPTDFRWPHLRGLVLIDEQRLEEAAAAFAEAYSRRPYYPSLLRQARVEQELGHLERADTLLEIAAAHSPSDPALLAILGEQAGIEGKHAAAIDLLSRALATAPGATRLHYPLALSYRATGDAAAAAHHLALAGRVGIVPLDPVLSDVYACRVGATAWVLEGQRALQAGDAQAAVKAFRKALEARPDDSELVAQLRAAESTVAKGAAAEPPP